MVQTTERQTVKQPLNILEEIWKESVVDKRVIIFRHSPEGTEETHRKLRIFGIQIEIRITYIQNTSQSLGQPATTARETPAKANPSGTEE